MAASPLDDLLTRWRQADPARTPSEQTLARAPCILEALVQVAAHPETSAFRAAVEQRDPAALSALASLHDLMARAGAGFLQRAAQARRAADWSALRRDSAAAALFLKAAAPEPEYAQALMLHALAQWRTNGRRGAAADYREAIVAAAGEDRLLAVAHGNLAQVLGELGEFDASLRHFRAALRHERDPRGRAQVLQNASLTLRQLGELDEAVRRLQEAIEALQADPAIGRDLPVAMDNMAAMMVSLGRPERALEHLERARTLFAADDLAGRAVNALSRAACLRAMQRDHEAGLAFADAHELACEHARATIDVALYRDGFAAAHAAAVPVESAPMQMFIAALQSKDQDDAPGAWRLLEQAEALARKSGDLALALRIKANMAALLFDRGARAQARAANQEVAREAAQRGLARPELMALGSLGSLAEVGAEDVHGSIGALGFYARSRELLRTHTQIVKEAGLQGAQAQAETYDSGTVANELAKLAERYAADGLSVEYGREALALARAMGDPFSVVNRLAGLRAALERMGDHGAADAAAHELETLAAGELPQRARLVLRRALGDHACSRGDRACAIRNYREACASIEALRAQQPPGEARTQVLAHYPRVHRTLARLLREEGDQAAAYAAVLGEKGRRLLDSLAVLTAANAAPRDEPPSVAEAQSWIAQFNRSAPTVLVDIVVEPKQGVTAYLLDGVSLRTVHAPGDVEALEEVERGDVRAREERLVRLCREDAVLARLAEGVSDAAPRGARLLLAPDESLQNLPLHLAPVQGRPWCELFELSYLAAVGQLRFASGGQRALTRALVAGDSRGDLPHAAQECVCVGAAFGVEPLIGGQCTRTAVEQALRSGAVDVVHLAVHGRGDARRGGRASLLLGDGAGGLEWTAFDALEQIGWNAALVVFSGCSTATAGPRDGGYRLSVADSAAATGASAVIACLWPVADEAARIFMGAFYERLIEMRAAASVDLRTPFEHARKTLRAASGRLAAEEAQRRDGGGHAAAPLTGESAIAGALIWAPFILVGDPLVRAHA